MALSSRTGKPHYLGHRRRIKNRFISSSLDAFSDYEVLELLLTFAIMQKDVKPIAKDMVHRFSSFQGVLDAPVSELIKIKGISEHAALLIKLVKACSDYYLRKKIISRKDIIASPDDLFAYCTSSMAALDNEQFRVIHLNSKNEVIYDEIIQEGTVDQTVVYPRKIMERALEKKSVALILVHNHPSGDPAPSRHDMHLTRSLAQPAGVFNISIHDHIIIGSHGHYSFREHGNP